MNGMPNHTLSSARVAMAVTSLPRLPADIAERGQHHEPGDRAGKPVVVPAGRHGIGVRAGQHGGRAPIPARQRAVEVARVVVGGLQPERAGGIGKPLAGEVILRAPGRPGHAGLRRARSANLVEQRFGQRQPRAHGRAQRLRVHGAKTSRISS